MKQRTKADFMYLCLLYVCSQDCTYCVVIKGYLFIASPGLYFNKQKSLKIVLSHFLKGRTVVFLSHKYMVYSRAFHLGIL